MKSIRLMLAAALLLVACSKVTQENFAKIRDDMPEQEVLALLGPPTTSSSVQILGISGTHLQWESGDAAISVRFVNGKVATKSFHKPAAKQ